MQLIYFAWVREKIGTSSEEFEKPETLSTVEDLIAHLATKGEGYKEAFKDVTRIRIAVNQTYVKADHVINPDDEVAFFPPVTGG